MKRTSNVGYVWHCDPPLTIFGFIGLSIGSFHAVASIMCRMGQFLSCVLACLLAGLPLYRTRGCTTYLLCKALRGSESSSCNPVLEINLPSPSFPLHFMCHKTNITPSLVHTQHACFTLRQQIFFRFSLPLVFLAPSFPPPPFLPPSFFPPPTPHTQDVGKDGK